jgi:hypothetical protein
MALEFFCGEALCKRPVEMAGPAPHWPVRCAACGTPLYPADVLAHLPANELEPKRGELTIERNGVRVPFASEGARLPKVAARGIDDDADRLLAIVELDPVGAARKKRVMSIAVLVVVAVAVAVAIAIAAMR